MESTDDDVAADWKWTVVLFILRWYFLILFILIVHHATGISLGLQKLYLQCITLVFEHGSYILHTERKRHYAQCQDLHNDDHMLSLLTPKYVYDEDDDSAHIKTTDSESTAPVFKFDTTSVDQIQALNDGENSQTTSSTTSEVRSKQLTAKKFRALFEQMKSGTKAKRPNFLKHNKFRHQNYAHSHSNQSQVCRLDRCASIYDHNISENNSTSGISPDPSPDTSSDFIQDDVRGFKLADITHFARSGIQAIVNDSVLTGFGCAELPMWNLLSRKRNYAHIIFFTWQVGVLWFLSLLVRYCIMVPFRIGMILFGAFSMFAVQPLLATLWPKTSQWRNETIFAIQQATYRIFAAALGCYIEVHNPENVPKNDGICVANHTSPIDVLVLAVDNCYSMIGQSHPGVFGAVQWALNKSYDHLWFERSEVKDRQLVSKRLEDHVRNPMARPLLIFPEGVCINNTRVMQFKKGTFEVPNVRIYPAAIKYHQLFADPFWGDTHFITHVFDLITSWGLVCDIWYLEPTMKEKDESPVQFASRVRSRIAQCGGLVDIDWDGYLKFQQLKPAHRHYEQKLFAAIVNRPLTTQHSFSPSQARRRVHRRCSESLPVSAHATIGTQTSDQGAEDAGETITLSDEELPSRDVHNVQLPSSSKPENVDHLSVATGGPLLSGLSVFRRHSLSSTDLTSPPVVSADKLLLTDKHPPLRQQSTLPYVA